VETAWDGDEWASSGATYNPRTGISTETDRYYSEDSNKMKMERTVEGPGGREMDVKKTTDFDSGTRTTERKTSAGGKSEVTRQRQSGGGYTTEGSFETAGGKSGTISGEHQGGQGSTTITGEGGQSLTTDTVRKGDRSVTKAEGSGGGSAVSVGNDGNRTTIGQSGSGDIYAGHDGNVYRKTEDGWQQHGDGGWSDVDVPDRPGNGDGSRPGAGDDGLSGGQFDAARTDGSKVQDVQRYGGSGSLESHDSRDAYGGNRNGGGTASRPATSNYQQLNRDAVARQGGYQSHERRAASYSSGFSRGGGARARRR